MPKRHPCQSAYFSANARGQPPSAARLAGLVCSAAFGSCFCPPFKLSPASSSDSVWRGIRTERQHVPLPPRRRPRRKPARQSTSRLAMDTRPTLRGTDDAAENRINTKQKGSSQPGKSLFIPVESFGHLRLGFRTDDEPTDHCLLRIRSLTISHGEPSSGLR